MNGLIRLRRCCRVVGDATYDSGIQGKIRRTTLTARLGSLWIIDHSRRQIIEWRCYFGSAVRSLGSGISVDCCQFIVDRILGHAEFATALVCLDWKEIRNEHIRARHHPP